MKEINKYTSSWIMSQTHAKKQSANQYDSQVFTQWDSVKKWQAVRRRQAFGALSDSEAERRLTAAVNWWSSLLFMRVLGHNKQSSTLIDNHL